MSSYRLGNGTFFFKVYPNPIGAPTKDGLLRGMYFPLSYWTSLVASPEVRGPRGGVRITYENSGRHLTNTQFADLVGSGWVGSSPQHEKMLTDVIAEALAAPPLGHGGRGARGLAFWQHFLVKRFCTGTEDAYHCAMTEPDDRAFRLPAALCCDRSRSRCSDPWDGKT